jgi:hypothetical protein
MTLTIEDIEAWLAKNRAEAKKNERKRLEEEHERQEKHYNRWLPL